MLLFELSWSSSVYHLRIFQTLFPMNIHCFSFQTSDFRNVHLLEWFFVIYLCLFSVVITFRQREEGCSFISKICELLSELLNHALDVVQEHCNSLQERGSLGPDSIFEGLNAIVTSFRSFACSPIFILWRDENVVDSMLSNSIIQSLERISKALARLYEKCSEFKRNLQSERVQPDSSVSDLSTRSPDLSLSNKSRIMDVELDVDNVPKDSDTLTVGGNTTTGTSFSVEKWKFGMIELISTFFPVLPDVTWNVLFDLLEKECDSEVCHSAY